THGAAPGRRLDRPQALEARIGLIELAAQLIEAVIAEFLAEDFGERAEDAPIRLGIARREDREAPQLRAALGVHIGAVLFGIGGAGQDDIGTVGATVAMMALIDDEGLAQAIGVDFVGAEQIDDVEIALLRSFEDTGDITPA